MRRRCTQSYSSRSPLSSHHQSIAFISSIFWRSDCLPATYKQRTTDTIAARTDSPRHRHLLDDVILPFSRTRCRWLRAIAYRWYFLLRKSPLRSKHGKIWHSKRMRTTLAKRRCRLANVQVERISAAVMVGLNHKHGRVAAKPAG